MKEEEVKTMCMWLRLDTVPQKLIMVSKWNDLSFGFDLEKQLRPMNRKRELRDNQFSKTNSSQEKH